MHAESIVHFPEDDHHVLLFFLVALEEWNLEPKTAWKYKLKSFIDNGKRTLKGRKEEDETQKSNAKFLQRISKMIAQKRDKSEQVFNL